MIRRTPAETDALRQAIAAFPRWHYEFDLDGVRTPIADPSRINRHKQRKAYFFEPLVEACGGNLAGKRVLDLGCNAGFWSLAAIEAGADFVLGLDGRAMHIEQARLVFAEKRIDPQRYRFAEADFFEFDFASAGVFDIVLVLGVMYHVNRPIELMQRVSGVNTDMVVIDTALYRSDEAVFGLRHESVSDPRNALRDGLVMLPSRAALVGLCEAAGYRGVVLRPDFDDYTGAEDFQGGWRRAVLAAKLSALQLAPERVEARFPR